MIRPGPGRGDDPAPGRHDGPAAPLGPTLRQARIGVTTMFVILGISLGSLASRLPAIKGQLHLSAGSLGLALLGSALGSVVSAPVSGAVLARVAPRRWIAVGLVPFAAVLPFATLAGGRWSLLAVLFGEGFGMGCVDVGMNTEATRVQTLFGRRILSGIHAAYSLGALAGAAIGAVCAAASIGFGTQFVGVGAVVLLAGGAALLWLPDTPASHAPVATPGGGKGAAAPGDGGAGVGSGGAAVTDDHRDPAGSGRHRRAGASVPTLPRLRWPIVALAVVSFGALLAEGSVNDWSAVYIHTSLGAPAATSALGYAAFSATMVAGRLGGDRLTARWGALRVVRSAAVLGAAGLGAALLVGNPGVAIAGFGLLGFGLAVTFPLAIGAAAGQGALGPSVALVTSAGYLGLLCGPPLIGGLATLTSLPVALGLPVVLCVVLAALAGYLRGGDPTLAPVGALVE